jgi:biopolymer transport protein ExbD
MADPSALSRAPANIVRFKAALRKAIRRNAREPEVDFLNITAMLDLMTIILVFMLKSAAASAATLPPSNDLNLPTSMMSSEPAQDGVAVVVSRSQILVGDDPDPVLRLPAREQIAVAGAGAKYKRSGPDDLYIVPLGEVLARARETDKAVREAKGLPPASSEASLVIDASTPYRLVVEVLYTLGQSEFGRYHLLVLRRGRK